MDATEEADDEDVNTVLCESKHAEVIYEALWGSPPPPGATDKKGLIIPEGLTRTRDSRLHSYRTPPSPDAQEASPAEAVEGQ